ncbi:hypothetical protein GCM10017322_40000 [Paracoccus aerius]|nr:hypothetical protein GCM10017322_40000 [Paracoccus aerius]
MLAAIPATKTDIGKVARESSGAIVAPSTAPVAKMIVECAPTKACATVSRQMAALPDPNLFMTKSFHCAGCQNWQRWALDTCDCSR